MVGTRSWTQVVGEIPDAFIVMVNGDSPEVEKLKVVEFSRTVTFSEASPYLGIDLFDEPWKCHVFAAVVDGGMVGYAKILWVRSDCENSEGQLLGQDRIPLPSEQACAQQPSSMQFISFRELCEQVREGRVEDVDEDDDVMFPFHLKTWCGAGIGVLPEYRRRGIATALLRKAAECLETELEYMAFSITMDDGEALLQSLGLRKEDRILWPH